MNLTGQLPYQKNQKKRRTRSQEQREDAKFLEWIRTLPSAFSGKYPCIAAHYRTAANSGTGIKPLFSAIPLTWGEHQLQHQIGQYSFMPRDWWERKVAYYVDAWKARGK